MPPVCSKPVRRHLHARRRHEEALPQKSWCSETTSFRRCFPMTSHGIPTGLSRLTTRKWYVTVPTFFPPLSYRPTSTLQVDRFQSFSLVIRHVISAQLSARLGSVTLGRRRRSLDSDLDISTHRLEISGKVARPIFVWRKVARRREHGRTDARTHRIFCPSYPAHCAG